MVRTGESSRTLYEIELKEVQITSITTAGGPAQTVADTFGGMTFAETVTLSGQSVRLTYYSLRPDGTPGAVVTNHFQCN